jgi:hypothetical protein
MRTFLELVFEKTCILEEWLVGCRRGAVRRYGTAL